MTGIPVFSVESIVLPKQRNVFHSGEDFVGSSGNTFWLLDGASTPTRLQAEGTVLSGQWMAANADLFIRAILAEDPSISLTTILRGLDGHLSDGVKELLGQEPSEAQLKALPHTTVVLVRVHLGFVEYALLQDSTLVIHGGDKPIQLIKDARQDEFNKEFYERIHAALVDNDAFGPRYNKLLDDMVDRERIWRNENSGFFTLTGFGEAEANAFYGSAPLAPNQTVTLVSDGVSRAWELMGANAEEFMARPLGEAVAWIREQERADPDGSRFPRIGVSDDISMLRIKLTTR